MKLSNDSLASAVYEYAFSEYGINISKNLSKENSYILNN